MGINGLGVVLEDLFLKPVTQVENNVVGVSFNGESEEVNVELDTSARQVLEC